MSDVRVECAECYERFHKQTARPEPSCQAEKRFIDLYEGRPEITFYGRQGSRYKQACELSAEHLVWVNFRGIS